jgi:adenylate kinase
VSLNVLILGPQGSGKGTQAARIAEEYDIPHVATGEMFRRAIALRTPLGLEVEPILAGGTLVPDELTIDLMGERLGEDDTTTGFVLDGFPRNAAQAEALDELLGDLGRPLDVVLELEVPDAVCLERLLGRSGEEGRVDDTPEVVAKRLEIYHRETAPLVSHYLPGGNVVGIDGDRPKDEVWAEIVDALERVSERPRSGLSAQRTGGGGSGEPGGSPERTR